jgi:hypothetical protein
MVVGKRIWEPSSGHPAAFSRNLRVTKTADGGIVLDPGMAGYCVVKLDEAEAGALCHVLTEWMGREVARRR